MKKALLLSLLTSTLILGSCGSSKKVATSKKTPPRAVQTTPMNVSTKEKKPKKSKEDPYVHKHIKKLEKSNTRLNPSAVLYIQNYADIAMEEMRVYKIPASITLAQGMLESGNGNSTLASKSNNHFGVKCHQGWSGAKVYHDDDKKGECFRKYKYVHTSYKDHSLFLTQRSRYDFLFDYRENDYRKWAKGLKQAGYATDPKYPQKLIELIERYQLEDFDAYVLKKSPKKYKSSQQVVYTPPKKSKNGVHVVQRGETLYSISKTYGVEVSQIKKWNKLKSNELIIGQELKVASKGKSPSSKKIRVDKKGWHTVQKGETMYSISKLYGMSVEDLKKQNKLKSNELSTGMSLKVDERKSNDSKAKTHVVKKGETLYSISKKYNISVGKLKKLNKLSSNELNIGQELKLN